SGAAAMGDPPAPAIRVFATARQGRPRAGSLPQRVVLCESPRAMANANIYLHEIIDIVGAGSEPYKRHTGEGWSGRWRQRSSELVGLWQQSGSTGDWPRVINLWEMEGYDHWAEILERQYSGEGQPPALRRWWTRALAWRSGG